MNSPNHSAQSKPNGDESLQIDDLIKIVTRFHADLELERPSISSPIEEQDKITATQRDSNGNIRYKKKKKKKDGLGRNLCQFLRGLLSGITTPRERSSGKEEEKTDDEKHKTEMEVSNNDDDDQRQHQSRSDKICNEYLEKIKSASTKKSEILEVIKNHIASFEGILGTTSNGGGPIQAETCLDKIREEVTNFKGKLEAVADRGHSGNGVSMEMFKEFQKKFEVLGDKSKFCLMCFAVFPENAIIRKVLVENWFMAEDLHSKKTEGVAAVEGDVDGILNKLVLDKFIDPVSKKRRKEVKRFRMHPLAHRAVIKHAESESPWCNWARLEGSEKGSTQPLMVAGSSICKNSEKLLALVNISDQFPDLQSNWFSNMTKIKVLYLGRWKNSANRFVDVQSIKFLKELKSMGDLRLLSLQGVYGIRDIPGSSIENLTNLRVLDLRCCYYLTKLPKELDSLKMLTYLDISECYLLEYMPKELASLSELQVLKGFKVTDVKSGDDTICTLQDLETSLRKLRKLSIYVNNDAISMERLSNTLLNFKQLRKLKIAWGAGSSSKGRHDEHTRKQDDGAEESQSTKGGSTASAIIRRLVTLRQQDEEGLLLEKLDLHCFPRECLPSWLSELKNLRKLYIRGGRLRSLGFNMNDSYSSVEVLRLRYLSDLYMNWRELQALFPYLEYLEKFNCPLVSLFPCDANGVWERDPSLKL